MAGIPLASRVLQLAVPHLPSDFLYAYLADVCEPRLGTDRVIFVRILATSPEGLV
jgi:hypothetical protein